MQRYPTTRRDFLRALGIGVGATLLPGCAPAPSDRPNLILLLTDDQRADAVGYAGNAAIRTPHMDAIASEGTIFPNAFVTTSICPVSRVSILTGQYMRRHGIIDFVGAPTREAMRDSYPALLRRAGYFTGFVGKWGIGTTQAAADAGAAEFDYWAGAAEQGNYWHESHCPYVTSDGMRAKTDNVCTCPPSGPKPRRGREGLVDPVHLTTDVTPAHCARFLDAVPEGQPFCLSVSFKAPHSPRSDYHPDFEPLYQDAELPLPPTATAADAERLPRFLRSSPSSAGDRLQPDALRSRLEPYYRLITGVDRAIGEIRRALAQRGLAENTILVFTSDNGYLVGEHGLTSKWLMHEGSIRVPLVILDPRLHAGERAAVCEEMALNIDVAPTLLDLAGIAAPERMQGTSLRPALTEPAPTLRADWFYEYHFRTDRYPIERTEGIRTRRWKYVRYLDQRPQVEQLFDLASDPQERRDLAGDPAHRAQLERLRARWREQRRDLV